MLVQGQVTNRLVMYNGFTFSSGMAEHEVNGTNWLV